jgi:ribosomal protein S27AE
MKLDLDNLQDDSPDFTEGEAKSATAVSDVSGMIEYLRSQCCGQCGNALFPAFHEQRRRGGIMYCRMRLACGNLHETPIVFHVQALQVGVG